MNLGYYEMMDRVSLLQNNLENYVRHHEDADDEVKQLVDKAQDVLSELYSYLGEKFYDSCENNECP